jgi:putative DNA methylase
MTVKTRKKLIEVALPLEAINAAAAREKSIRHGHPSTLHLWWARRPLAAARAVIFAQMVDDPSEYVEVLLGNPETRRAAERELKRRHALHETRPAEGDPAPPPRLEECAADLERQRLFRLIEQLVQWENTTNEEVLQRARDEIWASWRRACADNAGHPRAAELFDRHRLPAFHDPFCGGGSLPLEAQRLGLEAHASDLNPVAVLITKAMIEIPPRFAGRPPVHPKRDRHRHWKGAQGLAEDVRHYGQWMREEAERRIGHLYPKIEVTPAMVAERPDLKPYLGRKLTVIAWLWARTVRSPNPAFAQVEVPLASSFLLSSKAGKEAWVEPVIEGAPVQDLGMGGGDLVGLAERAAQAKGYRFVVRVGKPPPEAKAGTKLARGANFRCVMSGTPIAGDYIKAEGQAGRMGARLMATVAEGERGRVYLSPTAEHEAAARKARPAWRPEGEVPARLTGGTCVPYGLRTWGDLFTDRQLVALTTFSDLVGEAMARVRKDALAAGLPDDPTPLRDGGTGATAYAEAVGVYLGMAVSKETVSLVTQARWRAGEGKSAPAFGRQALPMVWDFADLNPFAGAGGDFLGLIEATEKVMVAGPKSAAGYSSQADASSQQISLAKLISTDPPYYDNIGYADLSDFFYVWLRRSLRSIYPDLLATVAVPKAEELVATPYRHGSREQAEHFFLEGMTQAMRRLTGQAHLAFPVAIYYAFKQSETESDAGTASTGWETFLDAVIRAGFGISGTWPMRTENQTRLVGMVTNALASSIVLVCRPRPADAPSATRREFLAALKAELPAALRHLQKGNIAPVDLAQAAIGPGMAVFTRYAQVLDAEGKALPVREALALINATLDEVLAEQEGDFDADSRWALAWFEQHGFAEGEFGVAETLSKAKNTSVPGLAGAGILESRRGKVRLLRPAELPADWDPATDPRLTAWEMVHQLIRALEAGGEGAAAALVAKLGARAEVARELAYRLYVIAERKKRAAEALSYNGLVQSWPEIARLAREGAQGPAQGEIFEAAGG